jgi:hypothetical protein
MITLEKARLATATFYYAAKNQLKEPWVIGAGAVVGLSQGLKYGGSFKRGILGAAATVGTIMAATGLYNVVTYWDKIDKN